MKNILQREEIEYICDRCKKTIIFTPDCVVNFNFGYGSNMDGMIAEFHYCPDCSAEVWQKIEILNSEKI